MEPDTFLMLCPVQERRETGSSCHLRGGERWPSSLGLTVPPAAGRNGEQTLDPAVSHRDTEVVTGQRCGVLRRYCCPPTAEHGHSWTLGWLQTDTLGCVKGSCLNEFSSPVGELAGRDTANYFWLGCFFSSQTEKEPQSKRVIVSGCKGRETA